MTQKQVQIARLLFKKSLDQNGIISPKKVHQILTAIWREKPRGTAGILKAYRRQVFSKLKIEAVEVETAQEVKSKSLEKLILKKTGARSVIFKTNPSLTIGAKITHGDWVWDETLDAKLAQLTSGSRSDSSYR